MNIAQFWQLPRKTQDHIRLRACAAPLHCGCDNDNPYKCQQGDEVVLCPCECHDEWFIEKLIEEKDLKEFARKRKA